MLVIMGAFTQNYRLGSFEAVKGYTSSKYGRPGMKAKRKTVDTQSYNCKHFTDWWFLSPADEMCTTADCTQSGKHRVMVWFTFPLIVNIGIFRFEDDHTREEVQRVLDMLWENSHIHCEYPFSQTTD